MDKKTSLNSIVNQLVGATDPEEVKRLYREWADTYNSDLDEFGYVAPAIGLNLLCSLVIDKNALIHDAGCGTGLVGALLSQHGFAELHGSDFSTAMLAKAEQTGHYQCLNNLDFSGPLSLNSDTYDAVISIGVYSNRFRNHFLPEMLRTLKPGGWMVFSCREIFFDEVHQSVAELFKAGSVCQSSMKLDNYMTGQDASAYYVALQKAAH